MKRITMFLLLLCALSIVPLSCSSSLAALFRFIGRMQAGLSESSVLVNDCRIFYLEGGRGETVLLVHGFGADKDNWTEFSKYLTEGHRVIAVDLPGFGESTKIFRDKFDYESQSRRLHAFVRKLGLTKFHIAGNSMGGGISAEYAAIYPDEILSLGLLAPHGFKCPVLSQVQKELKRGNNPLVIKSPPDADRLLDYLFVIKPSIPGPLKSYFTSKAIENSSFNLKVFNDINDNSIDRNMGNIRAKTLILWGDKDRIIDVSCARVAKSEIRNSRVMIMNNCGHAPMLERPEETAKIYLDFITR